MTAPRKTAASANAPRAASAPRAAKHDAIKLLTDDHKQVKTLFKQYEKLVKADAEDEEKQGLAHQICTMLTIHTTVEEELFYPAARDVLGEDADLVDEAAVEHASAKDLIRQIQEATPADDMYDAKVTVLGEYIDHHVKEEEEEMFPKLKKAGMDTASLGEDMAERKEALMAEEGTAQ